MHVSDSSFSKYLIPAIAFAVGAAVGAVVALNYADSGEEDRPPIIVKSGSLIFESGTTSRPGNDWEQVPNTSDWQPDHPNGKRVNRFQLYFRGGTGTCVPVTVTDVTINFDPDGAGAQAAVPYMLVIRQRGGKPVPTVSGANLQWDGAIHSRLTTGTGGAISSVGSSSFQCDQPTEVWVELIK